MVLGKLGPGKISVMICQNWSFNPKSGTLSKFAQMSEGAYLPGPDFPDPICRTNISQGPNLPGPDLQGPYLSGPNLRRTD